MELLQYPIGKNQVATKTANATEEDILQKLVNEIWNNPDPVECCNRLTNVEYSQVLDLISHFKDIAVRAPVFVNIQVGDVATMVANCQRSAQFSLVLPEFSEITPEDRTLLARTAAVRVSWLRYAIVASNIMSSTWKKPVQRTKMPYTVERTFSMQSAKFITEITHALVDVPLDEPTIIIILSALYFSSDDPELTSVEAVVRAQEKYLSLLLKYLIWRRGCSKAAVLYPKLVNVITSFRSVQRQYMRPDHNIWLEQEEVDIINQELGETSPYLDYSVEERNANFKENCRLVLPADFQGADMTLQKFMHLIPIEDQNVFSDENLFDLIESLDVATY